MQPYSILRSPYVSLPTFINLQNCSILILICAPVTVTEVAGEKHRQWMGIAYNAGYASGIVIVPGVAYLLHEWRYIQLTISLPALLLLIHMWYVNSYSKQVSRILLSRIF